MAKFGDYTPPERYGDDELSAASKIRIVVELPGARYQSGSEGLAAVEGALKATGVEVVDSHVHAGPI